MVLYSPPLDQLLPTMHAVVLPLASASCVFFFGTELGRNTWVHYLATHRGQQRTGAFARLWL